MLVIEEKMLKLAKMQETLLKVSKDNRQENLEKYIKTISLIDTQAFEFIMEQIKHIDEHNQSLEEEVKYLKEIKDTYDQLEELQTTFKDNCENYGNKQIQLSDLSVIDIGYINKRISAILEYLDNLQNIELNKNRIQELSEKLIEEEKKKIVLDTKLEELEQVLRTSFGSVEGRTIKDGRLEYTNVKLEYEKIGFDLERLINDGEYLRSSIAYLKNEKREISEKIKVAEVCYNSIPSQESKQILDEINVDDLKVKYKLTMLEIVELLNKKCDNYDLFIEKRTNMLDLIKYRIVCMDSLGINASIDPFSRIKIKEQLEIVRALTDNSKVVSNMMREISDLNAKIEEMIFENNGHLIVINDIKEIIVDRIGFNDIDITPTVSFEELLVRQSVSDNQVIKVRSIGSKLNMGIITQKTSSVIKRVNQMMNIDSTKNVEKKEEIVPELLIVPVTSKKEESIEETEVTIEEITADQNMDEVVEVEKKEEELIPVLEVPVISTPTTDMFSEPSTLFENVVPFDEPALFIDRAEEDASKKENVVTEPVLFDKIEFVDTTNNNDNSAMVDDIVDAMPDVFWVTQDDKVSSTDESVNTLSFDEQINALLLNESFDNNKVKKKVA